MTRTSMVALALAGVVPAAGAQQGRAVPRAARALVFDYVTVVDVEHEKLVPAQQVVVVGNRIQAVGAAGAVKMPKDAQVVDARGKYLIPGLWDMHVHPQRSAELFYPLFVANGVLGIRDASSPVPLDTLRLWRQEILAGTRIGPPRQILSGLAIDGPGPCYQIPHVCADDTAAARHLVDSLQAAGADMLKMYFLSSDLYFVVAAEARRRGIPFGGHIKNVTAIEASDSGASLIDHFVSFRDGGWEADLTTLKEAAGIDAACWATIVSANVERCRRIAARMRQNGTWMVPTLSFSGRASDRQGGDGPRAKAIARHFTEGADRMAEFWHGATPNASWLRATLPADDPADSSRLQWDADSLGTMRIMGQVGVPIVAGTDISGSSISGAPDNAWRGFPGFSLHAELAMYVAEGLTPAEALRTATLNPALMLRATDSLGTVAAGKLADLVLLDGDPLTDITNTAAVRAVVANGRYFDRAALDQLWSETRARPFVQEAQAAAVVAQEADTKARAKAARAVALAKEAEAELAQANGGEAVAKARAKAARAEALAKEAEAEADAATSLAVTARNKMDRLKEFQARAARAKTGQEQP